MGWGGVGMMTFLAHEHIFDATEMCRSLHMNTSLMLRRTGVGWVGMMTFLAHQHIFDATEMMSVLNALQLYRNDCSSGKICVAPKDAFNPDSLSWLAWLA